MSGDADVEMDYADMLKAHRSERGKRKRDEDTSQGYARDRPRESAAPASSGRSGSSSSSSRSRDYRDDRDRSYSRRERSRSPHRDDRRSSRSSRPRDHEDRDREASSRSKEAEPPKPSGGGGGGGDGLRDMSTDEMNKLRATLGLPPLVEDTEDEKRAKDQASARKEQAKKEAEEEEQARKTMEVEDRIDWFRKKREEKAKLKKVKSLADSDSEEELDTSAWVERNRKLTQEKKLAEQKAKELLEAEQAAIEEAEKESHDPSGLKVAHDSVDFVEGETTILTLKDVRILDNDGEINEDGDELEDIRKVEADIAKKNNVLRAKKPKYNKFADEKQELLPQYAPEKKKEGFVIGEDVKAAEEESRRQKLSELQAQLGGPDREKMDLVVEKTATSDFYTEDELAAFSKAQAARESKKGGKKKKTKLRKKGESVLDALGAQGGAADEPEEELGSRADRERRKQEKDQGQRQETRDNYLNYQRATQKMAEESKALFEDEKDKDEKLFASLAEARKAAEVQKAAGRSSVKKEEQLAKRIEESRKRREAEEAAQAEDSGVVFTEMSEFIRNVPINVAEEEIEGKYRPIDVEMSAPPSKRIKTENTDGLLEPKQEPGEEDEMEVDSSEVPEGDEDSDDFDLEGPEVNAKGVGSFLSMLRATGGDNLREDMTLVAGRQNDVKPDLADYNPTIRLDRYDEFGRLMTIKEQYRQLCYSFHGKGPSKNKLEARYRKVKQEIAQKKKQTSDSAQTTLKRVQRKQKAASTPFVVLTSNISKIQQAAESESLKELELDQKKTTVDAAAQAASSAAVESFIPVADTRKGATTTVQPAAFAPVAEAAPVNRPRVEFSFKK